LVLGLLILTIRQIIDTIFVSCFIGIYAVGGIAVVLSIILLFSSIGRNLPAFPVGYLNSEQLC